MEENQIIQNEGVESEVVAIPTDNDTTAEVTTEPIQESTDTAESSKAITPEDTISKIVAKRLEQSREKIAKEVESKYAPFMKLAEKGAKENGMSVDEYLQAILEESDSEEPEMAIPKEYKEVLDKIVEQEKAQKEAEVETRNKTEEKAYFEKQAKLLFDLGVKDIASIPPTVLENAIENGTDIVYEYLLWDKKQAVTNAEQETIKKIQEQETAGSLTSGGGGDTGIDIFKMSYDSPEFKELLKAVKQGKASV